MHISCVLNRNLKIHSKIIQWLLSAIILKCTKKRLVPWYCINNTVWIKWCTSTCIWSWWYLINSNSAWIECKIFTDCSTHRKENNGCYLLFKLYLTSCRWILILEHHRTIVPTWRCRIWYGNSKLHFLCWMWCNSKTWLHESYPIRELISIKSALSLCIELRNSRSIIWEKIFSREKNHTSLISIIKECDLSLNNIAWIAWKLKSKWWNWYINIIRCLYFCEARVWKQKN